jgi:hypothetical protein
VCEWNEAIMFGSYRCLRGGTFGTGAGFLQSGDRFSYNPASSYSDRGFRVTQIPEPSTLMLMGFAVLGMVVRRRVARSKPLVL